MNNNKGGRIAEIRKKLGLTQSQFAEKIGLKFSAISMIELGKALLTEANIRLICLTFGVNEQWLRTGEGEIFVDNAQQDIKELLDIFDRLSPASRKMILDLARTILTNEQANLV
jgi:transcriptional regulator with XRE-family HTH domain